jgi:hypothetical protein
MFYRSSLLDYLHRFPFKKIISKRLFTLSCYEWWIKCVFPNFSFLFLRSIVSAIWRTKKQIFYFTLEETKWILILSVFHFGLKTSSVEKIVLLDFNINRTPTISFYHIKTLWMTFSHFKVVQKKSVEKEMYTYSMLA